MITLYPTETVYALGVNAFDPGALKNLCELKGRDEGKPSSWLVKDVAEIEKYAVMDEKAAKIAKRFLPGPFTLVLKAKDTVPGEVLSPDRMIGFRVSSDAKAQELAQKYNMPLTCTSANVSGKSTLATPQEILKQFGERTTMITEVIDDGSREDTVSTVVRVVDDEVEILREGAITKGEIEKI